MANGSNQSFLVIMQYLVQCRNKTIDVVHVRCIRSTFFLHPSKKNHVFKINENVKNRKDQFQIDSFPYCIALFSSIGLTRDNGDEFIFIHAALCPDNNHVFSTPQISSLFYLNLHSFGYHSYWNRYQTFDFIIILISEREQASLASSVVDETSSKKLIVKFSIIINYRWNWRWKD